MIYVQHLLGVGHLQRSILLAAELARQNFSVELVSGGKPITTEVARGIQFRQLDPVFSPDGSFKRLLNTDGVDIDTAWKERRKSQLLDYFTAFEPQILITETFPFGRRMMRFELLPLLAAARASTSCRLIIASIRDILQPKSRADRIEETCELVESYYDHILVHGDSTIARLEDSFSAATGLDSKVAYSGYICADTDSICSGNDGWDEVLVSAGGSTTGFEILKTAIAARPRSSLRSSHWRILVSPAIDQQQFSELQQLADKDITVERNRTDFSKLVKRAKLSISQAGYNTMTDLLNSNTAAVVIPYSDVAEIEQTLRAQKLQDHHRVIMLQQDELSASNLAASIEQALGKCRPLQANLEGAMNSAAMIRQWYNDSREVN